MAKNDTRLEPSDEDRIAAPPAATAPAATAPAVVSPAAAPSGWAQTLLALRWPVALVAVVLLAYLAYRDTLIKASNAAGTAAQAVGNAARSLLSGNVTETFLSSIPEFDPEGSGNLELAMLSATETFTRSDERKILWDRFSLGVTTSEIRVPVTYRYHLRLRDPWRLEIDGSVCTVRAPAVRPSLPPAIHTDRMEKRSDEAWLRFDGADQMADLERSVTPTLETYAADERHLGLVRENARRAVEEFVRTWLLREDQWNADRVQAIRVVFPDEEDAGEGLEDSPLEIRQPGE